MGRPWSVPGRAAEDVGAAHGMIGRCAGVTLALPQRSTIALGG